MGSSLLLVSLLVGAAPNLLTTPKDPAHARLTDGASADEGADWLAPEAVELRAESWPQWDLGASRTLSAAAIQADNNDEYVLEVSDDGANWKEAHRFGPDPEPGLRTRTGTLSAVGRYVRLRAEGGDGRYSVSEVEVFSESSGLWKSSLAHPLLGDPLKLWWGVLVLLAALALSILHAGSTPRQLLGLGGLMAALALMLLRGTLELRPIPPDLINWIRAVIAAIAFLAVARIALFREKRPAHGGFVTGVLCATGVLALLCFLNMGRPQFHDAGKNAPTFLHHYDMRAYFPIAKYFRELKYDGVYGASAAVLIEDQGLTPWLSAQPINDLRTNVRRPIGESQEYIQTIRARFTPERWKSFVADMNYFRRAMSDAGFVGSMTDHGGNATPVWFLGARAVFRNAEASDFMLWIGVLVDALLVLLAFGSIAWAYDLRTALVAMTVFGAMDLYMFGNNWFGAALRHDWIALWGIGLALLKKERFFLGGGVLAWAGLIRIFPILSFLTVTAPVLWSLGYELFRLRRAFSWRKFMKAHRNVLQLAAGALAFGVVLIGLSVLLFGVDAWPAWTQKILMMAGGRGINTVGLACIITNPTLLKLILVGFTLVTLFSIRTAPLHEAAAFGPVLIAVVFSPMNYYLHSLFLLAILGSSRHVFPWLVMLGMCVGCYFTTMTPDFFEHFGKEAWVTLAAMSLLVIWRLLPRVQKALAASNTPAASQEQSVGTAGFEPG